MLRFLPSSGATVHRLLLGALLIAGCSGSEPPTGTGGGGTPNVVAAVQLSGAPTGVLISGDTLRLVATATNASGAIVSSATVTWASSVPSVASVNSAGIVVPLEAGTTAISAAVGASVARVTLEVALGATIGAGGGAVVSTARRFSLVLPEGAVAAPTRFIVRTTPIVPVDARALAASAVDLTPAGVNLDMTTARLTLPYDAATLPATLARESLQLYMLDSARWVPVFRSTVDVVTRTVTGIISRTGTFVVRSTPVERIVLSGVAADGAIVVGDSSTIIATVSGGFPFDTLPRRPLTWTSSQPAVATVDSTGRVVARSVGTTTITASTDGQQATTTVTVTARVAADWSRAAEWTAFNGNAQHTGYVDATVDPSAFRLRWSVVPMTGASLYQVITGGSGVYANSFARFAGQSLVSLDPSSGATRWRKPFDAASRVSASAWDDGALYTQIVDGGVSALLSVNAADGSDRYRTAHTAGVGPWFDGPIVVGSAAVLGSATGVHGFTKETGAARFFRGVGSRDPWTPAAENGTAYYIDGGVTGVSTTTGNVTMQLVDPRFTESVTPLIAAPGVLVARMTERLIAVNLATSTVTWAVDGEIDYVVVAGRGTVYAFESGAMVARAVSDGSTSWTWMPPESCGTRTGMVITNNILFVGCEATTYALDLTARRPVWSYPAGGFLSLSGPQGALYIANGQQLTAISLR